MLQYNKTRPNADAYFYRKLVIKMPKDYELERLRQDERHAFNRKQEAYREYDAARKHTSAAHDRMEAAWRDRVAAKEAMDREFYADKEAREHSNAIWKEYGEIRDCNNAEIEQLRAEANAEHEAMQDAFARASNAYEYGDRSEAPYYASEGHDHKERRDELNERIHELAQEVKDAKAYAIMNAPPVDSSAFKAARDAYLSAKSHHLTVQAEFKSLKAERDQAKAIFDHWQAEHTRLKQEFQARLASVKAANQRERDQVLDKAGVRWSERESAKIVRKPDGTTQVYHGGIGSGDGIGHGHTALDSTGHKTYDRDAFSDHGSHNYTDNEFAANDCKTLAVGTDRFEEYPAKIRHRKDGKTDIFFNKYGNYGDGLGHGHIVLNRDGSPVYMRDEWQDKRQGQYLIDETKDDHTKF